jgi:hypothetical protein
VSEIEREVKKRSELAAKLQADVTRYSKLKELDAPQVEAVAQALRTEVQKESTKRFWMEFGMNFLFFVLGAAVTYWLARR